MNFKQWWDGSGFFVGMNEAEEAFDFQDEVIENKQKQIDELQKRIDNALDYANRNRNVSPLGNIALIDILKGNGNDTEF